jgi:hypothetical protein
LHDLAVHVLYERVDIALADFGFEVISGALSAGLLAFDVLSGDAYIDQFDVATGRSFGFLNGFSDGFHRPLNIRHYTPRDADRFTLPVTKDFNFAVFIAAADKAGDFRCTDVEADDQFVVLGSLLLGIHG